jgi:TolB-like protein
MACKLRRALERYYHGPGQHAAWRLEVPRGGYRPLFERADVRSDPACLISIPTRFAHGTPAEADQRQVLAVLPLWPLTSGAEELALAEAVACETCVKLRKFHWLEVLDYLVTRRWHQSHGGQHDQEQAQRCDYLIDGMCRRLGGQVRLTVQLTSVPDGHLPWAEQFDLACASSDFANEDAVVAGICRGIGSALHRGVPRSQQAGAAERPRRTRSQTWQPTPSPTVFPESDRQPVAAPKH